MSIDGFNDKASLLLHALFSALVAPVCSSEEFDIYKTSLTDEYRNKTKELPVLQAMTQVDELLLNMPTHEEKEKSLQQISFENFSYFWAEFSTRLYIQALLYGNISESDARQIDASLSSLLKAAPYPVASQPKETILTLSDSYRPRKIVQTTQRQGNGALLLLQQGAYSFEKRGIQQILGTALQDAFFDTLRTKQQTGYYVRAWNKEEQRQLLQYFAVQSSTHSSNDLLARFELFLEAFDKNLIEMIPQERFISLKENLITLLSMPPENMSYMAAQLNLFAFEYEDFTWVDKRIASLKSLTYERFCDVAHTFLSRSNHRRLAVLMNGVLLPENDFHYDHISKKELSELGTFIKK
jgi:insulysin